jgi:ribosome-associated protein
VDESKPSKSARKREYLALQKLGEDLITLRESELLSMPLDEDLLEAVQEARRIKAHGALRRQKQYIGKLMRHVDPEPINAALERLRHK